MNNSANVNEKGLNDLIEPKEKEQKDFCELRQEMTPQDKIISLMRLKLQELIMEIDKYYAKR